MRVGLVLCPGFQAVCFGAIAAFDVANKHAGEIVYDVHVLSEEGGLVTSSAGLKVLTEPFNQAPFDTLIVAAGLEIPTSSPGLIRLPRASSLKTRGASHPYAWARCSWRRRVIERTARDHPLALRPRVADEISELPGRHGQDLH